jgi:magnesium transporter
MPSSATPAYVSCIDYGPGHYERHEIADLKDFLEHHRPGWAAVRWIDVDGIRDMRVIHSLATKYHLHPLAIEGLLNTSQRPKVDQFKAEGEFQARLFISARMAKISDDSVHSESVSIFLGHATVMTFQQTRGDVWDGIRQRLASPNSRLRANDASFLVYSLLDAIVDECFPIIERVGDRLDELEDAVLSAPTAHVIGELHRIKRALLELRRAVWPMREVIRTLQEETHECFSETARTYMRDVYDHLLQMIEVIDAHREVAVGLTDAYMSSVSIRMNEVMKLLTLISTIFIPLTFLAGVYGMNFQYIPELDNRWAYPVFWATCILLALSMLAWFRRRGWV